MCIKKKEPDLLGHLERHTSISCSCMAPLAWWQTASFSSLVTLQSKMMVQETNVPISQFSDRGRKGPNGGDPLYRSEHPALPFLPGHGEAMK